MLTHGSLFAGIDAFGYGFAKAGIKTLWRVEIDRDCQRVLRRHHPDDLLLSDVRDCGARNLPPVDIISFGSPCQDLSGAGKQVGLMGDRSVLFFEGIRILAELNPAFAVWENVPRARTIHRGRDFATILRAFRQRGACDIAWRTLDSRYCGVAQRRQRVFLVADFRGERSAEILFEPSRSSWHPAASRKAGPRVAAAITSGVGVTGNAPGRRREDDVNLVFTPAGYGEYKEGMGTIRAEGGDCGPGSEMLVFDPTQITSPYNYSNPKTGDPCHPITATAQAPCIAFTNRGLDTNDQTETMRAKSHGAIPMAAIAFTERTRKDGRTLEMQEDLAYAVTNPGSGGRTHSRQLMHGMCVRRLTPTEVERLFAFPDGYTAFDSDGKPISDSTRYRMLGNSIVTTIPEWLGRRILAAEAVT